MDTTTGQSPVNAKEPPKDGPILAELSPQEIIRGWRLNFDASWTSPTGERYVEIGRIDGLPVRLSD